MTRVLLILVLLTSFSWVFPAAVDDWEKTRSIAESQHDIVMLLIKNRQYDKVLVASKKIFALNFPPSKESMKVEHAKVASAALSEQGNYGLAHQILDEALKAVASNKSKVVLYKEKAVVCSKHGQDAQAMKFLEEAVRLEEAP